MVMPKCKILGQYDLRNYFYGFLKIAFFWDFYMASPYIKMNLGEKASPRFVFIWKVHIIIEKAGDF